MNSNDRALGAFYGLALGDALGMPTQSFSRAQIIARFGQITGLVDAPADQPIAPNMPKGSITDDTEQAILVAQLLVDGNGDIDPNTLAQRLIAWEAVMQAKGSQDLLGPSTKRAIEMILAGHSPEESGRYGTTNGAAMRIAPVGIAADISQPDLFIKAVVQACQVTHNTSLGIASAAAVAAVISSGLNGKKLEHALNAGTEMAYIAEHHGHWVAGGRIGPRIRWARHASHECNPDNLGDLLYDVIGTSVASQESVVAAFALAQRVASGSLSSFNALCIAASIGGDTDTIAGILGAMLGACAGLEQWPQALIQQVKEVNNLQLEPLVEHLLILRNA
ncbi:ADP-ribosylglycohydrolase [Pseudomonas sp. FSL R10-1350]|jgi:ADP-ribosylglycohydrolase|uniref:ADP-ribosylglycohydrolase n=1 Tax=Pseudomonas helleri TaxID=1608996 RepID=A0A0J6IAS1_9PSED|nr:MULTISPECIES: ADP-ribosylglycohydrolase family protein [Pseudomonas]KMN09478.1 ADP-ribosylglycohydrolase [Pseudomonas helleri]MQT30847.1 ADP-ribosylglycohydrolase [Pseudomonas helleri]MQT36322.1 ADP-ribosylglycohydrolase [Pseudomonas helleri]MQT48620.1 ADP-ribosylglycohydrolase [Pseudomonas helleri]MQT74985.1 ADP-ribosylglycohydrolase [Pseudomonas helleri]